MATKPLPEKLAKIVCQTFKSTVEQCDNANDVEKVYAAVLEELGNIRSRRKTGILSDVYQRIYGILPRVWQDVIEVPKRRNGKYIAKKGFKGLVKIMPDVVSHEERDYINETIDGTQGNKLYARYTGESTTGIGRLHLYDGSGRIYMKNLARLLIQAGVLDKETKIS